MSSKGAAAQCRILESAQQLFSQKGFCAVTMQDICHATGFSRGGLYRHYSSTEEIFIDIILQEQAHAYSELQRAKGLQIGPERILRHFLQARMRALSQCGNTFDVAISEFAANSERGRQVLALRAQESISILSELIRWGNREGCFACPMPQETASHILWLTEGMSRHSSLLPISEEDIRQQLLLIRQLLGQKEPS